MNIKILQLIEGALEARGHAVIIDVFRAFTTACTAYANGAERIIVTSRLDTAFSLREENPGCILMGERNEKMVSGFDFGNSPTAIKDVDFKGRLVVQTTSAGTQGIAHAGSANEVIAGSFVNAGAVARYLRAQDPADVSLVCMGYATDYPTEEDTYCARYISNELKGLDSNFDAWVEEIRRTSGRRFFLEENQAHAPATDFDLCLRLNRYDFILKAIKIAEDRYELLKIPA